MTDIEVINSIPVSIADVDSKPFDKSYVLRITANNVRKSIDISISKTTKRISDFPPDTLKYREVLDTLHVLHVFRSIIDDFQAANEKLFKKDLS